MSSRVFRPIAATLIVLLFSGTSAHAGPVSIRQVVMVFGRYQDPPKVELIQVPQSRTPISGANGSTQEPSGAKPNPPNVTTTASATSNPSDSLLSGILVKSDGPQVSVINQGDLEGTICDCGEIIVPVGGIPKWPLLFLGAIPLLFIHHGDSEVLPRILPGLTPTPTPTPMPTPTPVAQVPEPSSLLLLVSGLGALGIGWRRRRAIANRTAEKTGARIDA